MGNEVDKDGTTTNHKTSVASRLVLLPQNNSKDTTGTTTDSHARHSHSSETNHPHPHSSDNPEFPVENSVVDPIIVEGVTNDDEKKKKEKETETDDRTSSPTTVPQIRF